MVISCFSIAFFCSVYLALLISMTNYARYTLIMFILLTITFTILFVLLIYGLDYKEMLDNRLTYKWKNVSFAEIKEMLYKNIHSKKYISSNNLLGFYDNIKTDYTKIADQEFEQCGMYEYYTDSKIYKNGTIYILSFQDLIKYQAELSRFKKQMARKKDEREAEKRNLIIQTNKIR